MCHCGNCIFHSVSHYEKGIKCRRDNRYHDQNYICKSCEDIVPGEHPRDAAKRADEILSNEKDRSKQRTRIWLWVIGIIVTITLFIIEYIIKNKLNLVNK